MLAHSPVPFPIKGEHSYKIKLCASSSHSTATFLSLSPGPPSYLAIAESAAAMTPEERPGGKGYLSRPWSASLSRSHAAATWRRCRRCNDLARARRCQRPSPASSPPSAVFSPPCRGGGWRSRKERKENQELAYYLPGSGWWRWWWRHAPIGGLNSRRWRSWRMRRRLCGFSLRLSWD